MREALASSPYEARAIEVLRLALDAPGAEAEGIVAMRGDAVIGVAVYGELAGAVGAGRLHLVAVAPGARGQGVGSALVAHAARALRERGARFLLAEVPDDPHVLGDYWALLVACGFFEESRVADFYRDGIALAFLRRALTP